MKSNLFKDLSALCILIVLISTQILVSCEGNIDDIGAVIYEESYLNSSSNNSTQPIEVIWNSEESFCLNNNHHIIINPTLNISNQTNDSVLKINFYNNSLLTKNLKLSDQYLEITSTYISGLDSILIPIYSDKIEIIKETTYNETKKITLKLSDCSNDLGVYNSWDQINFSAAKTNFNNMKVDDIVTKFYSNNSNRVLVQKIIKEIDEHIVTVGFNVVVFSFIPVTIDFDAKINLKNKSFSTTGNVNQETYDLLKLIVDNYFFEEIPFIDTIYQTMNQPLISDTTITLENFRYDTITSSYDLIFESNNNNRRLVYAVDHNPSAIPFSSQIAFTITTLGEFNIAYDDKINQRSSINDIKIKVEDLNYKIGDFSKLLRQFHSNSNLKNNSLSISKISIEDGKLQKDLIKDVSINSLKSFLKKIKKRNSMDLYYTSDDFYPFKEEMNAYEYIEAIILFDRR